MRTNMAAHVNVLQQYWEKGLIATKSVEQKKLADEVAQKTGLSYMQVKVSLRSYNNAITN